MLRTSQNFAGSIEKRERTVTAEVVEVVQVDGPDGRSAVATLHDQVGLLGDGLHVVITNPLPIRAISIGASGV